MIFTRSWIQFSFGLIFFLFCLNVTGHFPSTSLQNPCDVPVKHFSMDKSSF